MEKQKTSRTLAFYGLISALILVVLWIETGIMMFSGATPPAVLSIPIAIAFSCYFDLKRSFVGGTVLGICSFGLAFYYGLALFMNPMISLLPRIFIGFTAYLAGKLTRKLFGLSKTATFASYSVAGGVGVLTNTVLVLFMISVFGDIMGFPSLAFGTIVSFNFIMEFSASLVLVPVVVAVLQKVDARRIENAAEEEAEKDSSARLSEYVACVGIPFAILTVMLFVAYLFGDGGLKSWTGIASLILGVVSATFAVSYFLVRRKANPTQSRKSKESMRLQEDR